MTRFLIILDRASAVELQLAHGVVKQGAPSWWHHFSTTWIVTGGSVSLWRDRIKTCLIQSKSSVLVLQLPDEGYWAYHGPRAAKRCKWLKTATKTT